MDSEPQYDPPMSEWTENDFDAIQVESGLPVHITMLGPLSEDTIDFYNDQISLLDDFDFEHQIQLFEVVEHEGMAYLITERHSYTNLSQRLTEMSENNTNTDVNELWKLIANIGVAVEELHRVNLIHGNLSPDNIFFDENGTVFLWKSGLYPMPEDETLSDTQIIPYWPEEVLNAHKFSPKTDIYSLGMVLNAVINHPVIFSSSEPDDLIPEVLSYTPSFDSAGIDFLSQCCSSNADDRPTLSFILSQRECVVYVQKMMKDKIDKEKEAQIAIRIKQHELADQLAQKQLVRRQLVADLKEAAKILDNPDS
ncbi:putative Protein kinase domain containing protein [Blattamonas nauphoetae]|uniref:Protein kinase domain-containing protein n=1 Tax=Blattamonas nauphoetae TaxID=2049346 RepID=A0ABQ9YC62_9EUKA|nr:putative Protein kinase domain containing protein [Blattamonas nauphoetae]